MKASARLTTLEGPELSLQTDGRRLQLTVSEVEATVDGTELMEALGELMLLAAEQDEAPAPWSTIRLADVLHEALARSIDRVTLPLLDMATLLDISLDLSGSDASTRRRTRSGTDGAPG